MEGELYDVRGKINPHGLPPAIVKNLLKRVEQDHVGLSDAEKYRLLQAEVLLYVYYSDPDRLPPVIRKELDRLAGQGGPGEGVEK